jgi:hypothetical protein
MMSLSVHIGFSPFEWSQATQLICVRSKIWRPLNPAIARYLGCGLRKSLSALSFFAGNSKCLKRTYRDRIFEGMGNARFWSKKSSFIRVLSVSVKYGSVYIPSSEKILQVFE